MCLSGVCIWGGMVGLGGGGATATINIYWEWEGEWESQSDDYKSINVWVHEIFNMVKSTKTGARATKSHKN